MADRIRRAWDLDVEASAPLQKILPLSSVRRTYGDRLLVVGDAAGLVKSTTGGGIYYSLLSASLAADVLTDALANGDLRAESLAEYERRWRSALNAELTAQRLSDDDIEQLFDLVRTDGIMPIVRKTATFNRHRELILALLKHPPVRQILLRVAAS
jgi:flavin-dependent dehydrogenase